MRLPAIAITGLVRLRDFLLPVALFGLVVLGLHAGSDRLDDLAFRLLNGVDRLFDYVLSGVVKAVLSAVRAGPGTIARWTYAAVSLIDLEEKRWAARVLALGVELLADVMLVWPVLRYRRDRTPWRQAVPPVREIHNIGAVFAPIAVALAGCAGAVVVAQQAQLQLFWFFRFLGRTGASQTAGTGAILVLLFVGWRLVIPTVRAGLAFGRAQSEQNPWYRGGWMAGPLFIAALAMDPVHLWRVMRGLGPW